jgi:hypothetical protein
MEVSGQLHAPDAFKAGKVLLVGVVGEDIRWASEPVWT